MVNEPSPFPRSMVIPEPPHATRSQDPSASKSAVRRAMQTWGVGTSESALGLLNGQGISVAFLIVFTLVCMDRISNGIVRRYRL